MILRFKKLFISIAKTMAPKNSRRRSVLRKATRILGLRTNHPPDIAYYQWYSASRHRNTWDPTCKGPLISLIIPAFNTPTRYLLDCVYSVVNQYYQNWELIIVNASTTTNARSRINSLSDIDERINVVSIDQNLGIVGNTNIGLESARGEYVSFMDHDDVLHQSALLMVAQVIKEQNPDLIYTDEDKLTEDGKWRHQPHFKPDWSPHLLENVNYITHFVTVRAVLAKELGIRKGFDGAQDYDFLLRLTDIKKINVCHIPDVLYHWREANGSTAQDFSVKPQVISAGVRALKDHFDRVGKPAGEVIGLKDRPGFYLTKYSSPKHSEVAIIYDQTQLDQEVLLSIEQTAIAKKISCISIQDFNNNNHSNHKYIILISRNMIPKSPKHLMRLIEALYANQESILAPLITKDSHIVHPSLVRNGESLHTLFLGYHKNTTTQFGSVEWIRDVDCLDTAVLAFHVSRMKEVMSALADGAVLESSDLIAWSHAEFIQTPHALLNENKMSDRRSFGNPNIVSKHEIIGVKHD